MRQGFTQTESNIWLKVILIIALVACVIVLAQLLSRLQQLKSRPRRPHPMALFRRVQNKLGLSPADRWCLWWLARVLNIENPTALLISARLYDQAVYRYCTSRGWICNRARAAPRFAAIRQRVFDTDAE
jgi:hypothetical protein